MDRPRFHLAFPVRDLAEARAFYGDLLGCAEGRSSDDWVDFDFHGHQIVAHAAPAEAAAATSAVDGEAVPVRHFGVILTMDDWKALAQRLEARTDIVWGLKPKVRFVGQPGEQATLFIIDPSGNGLEFKGMTDDEAVFRA